MQKIRRIEMFLINLTVISWLAKVMIFDSNSDVFGVFTILTIFFLVIWNAYFILLNYFFPENEDKKILIEIAFVLLLMLPVVVLWYFTM